MLKLVIVFLLFAVMLSLFSGLFFLYRDHGAGTRTVRALTWRIGLSIFIFVVLLVGLGTGLIPR